MSTTPTPETTAVWNRHLCLTPELATDLLELCMTLERQRNAATTLAGELIAMIRVNVMRGTFREATVEQINEQLKPWIDRLSPLRVLPEGPLPVSSVPRQKTSDSQIDVATPKA